MNESGDELRSSMRSTQQRARGYAEWCIEHLSLTAYGLSTDVGEIERILAKCLPSRPGEDANDFEARGAAATPSALDAASIAHIAEFTVNHDPDIVTIGNGETSTPKHKRRQRPIARKFHKKRSGLSRASHRLLRKHDRRQRSPTAVQMASLAAMSGIVRQAKV